MDKYDKIYISEYDIEIEKKEQELKEIYRNEGEARWAAFQEGGFLAFIIMIFVSIAAIFIERIRIFGIIGLCVIVIAVILMIIGVRCRDNKIDELETEIKELKEKKKQDEKKYCDLR